MHPALPTSRRVLPPGEYYKDSDKLCAVLYEPSDVAVCEIPLAFNTISIPHLHFKTFLAAFTGNLVRILKGGFAIRNVINVCNVYTKF